MQSAKLARIWHDIMNATPVAESDTRCERENDRLAQPGYVGSHYNGTLLIGMNPGAGGKKETPINEEVFAALRALKHDENHIQAFRALNVVLAKAIPTWNIHRNLVVHILSALRMELNEVAWINLLKWRTAPGVNPKGFYEASWEKHTRIQVEALAPKRIILLGVETGNWFKKKYGGDAEVIPRSRGDVRLSDKTKLAINSLHGVTEITHSCPSGIETDNNSRQHSNHEYQFQTLSNPELSRQPGLQEKPGGNRNEFWCQLLDKVNERTELCRDDYPWKVRRQKKYAWLERGVQEFSKVSLVFGVTENKAWVELCIQRGEKDSEDLMCDIEREKTEIENDFGERLEWYRRQGVQRRKIMSQPLRLGIEDKGQWRELQHDLVGSMIRFVAALRGRGPLPVKL